MNNRHLSLPPDILAINPLNLKPNTPLPGRTQATALANDMRQDVVQCRFANGANFRRGKLRTELKSAFKDVLCRFRTHAREPIVWYSRASYNNL